MFIERSEMHFKIQCEVLLEEFMFIERSEMYFKIQIQIEVIF
jgi:hypothetical protein